jgi:hypothetical protein
MRVKSSSSFKEGKKLIMFSSDVSARGMDYPGVTKVFFFPIGNLFPLEVFFHWKFIPIGILFLLSLLACGAPRKKYYFSKGEFFLKILFLIFFPGYPNWDCPKS